MQALNVLKAYDSRIHCFNLDFSGAGYGNEVGAGGGLVRVGHEHDSVCSAVISDKLNPSVVSSEKEFEISPN